MYKTRGRTCTSGCGWRWKGKEGMFLWMLDQLAGNVTMLVIVGKVGVTEWRSVFEIRVSV